jgi:uncharacterized protein YebE (UPF0316 family)
MLPDNLILGFIIILLLRVTDVSLGTIRTVYMLQGWRLLAAAIGFVEVTIFIYAISQVVSQLNDPVLMLAYSGGFALGTYLGLFLEERFAIGNAQLRIISQGQGDEVAQALRDRDFGATVVPGHGRKGPVELVFSIVPRRCITEIMRLASEIDSDSVISVSDSRFLFRGYMGFHGKRK